MIKSDKCMQKQCLCSQKYAKYEGVRKSKSGRNEGNIWRVWWELCSAVLNKWVLSVNINTEIMYWQKPCSTEGRVL